MGVRRTKVTESRPATRTKTGKKASSRTSSAGKTVKPTIASLAAQVQALAVQVSELLELVRSAGGIGSKKAPAPANGRKTLAHRRPAKRSANGAPKPEAFESDLLALVADLDRRGRHSGLVPIPELRDAFLDRGWTRPSFDDRLLQAERDFLVDLKAANDPARLTKPELAIQQPGRGHLQYVVAR